MNSTLEPDAEMASAIRGAVKDCRDRGLAYASKWASELLLSLSKGLRNSERTLDHTPATFHTSTPARPKAAALDTSLASPAVPVRNPLVPVGPSQTPERLAQEAELEAREEDIYDLARAAFDSKEFQRAVYLLQPCESAKAVFLGVYCQFLAGEKKALHDWHHFDNRKEQPGTPGNPVTQSLLEILVNIKDPWLLFLKALFLARLKRREEAIEAAILSIAGYQWNWSCWIVLGNCLEDSNELAGIVPLLPLPASHPLVQFLQLRVMNQLQAPSDEELAMCERLLEPTCFPTSCWIMALKAATHYHMHDFQSAEQQFERVVAMDPFRIDDIDIYSNILYVTENRLKLSRLAKEFLILDKDRPEVCCIVGNHYSLRQEHERAIKYFKRATQLDQTYLAAWTLMGHEYVEMKNSHAAIEAYRRAVDVGRKDYRAWYGLGQAYEMMNMHQYALHYYHKATALRPYDVRLWQAQGHSYKELGRTREAIECLKRALLNADPHEVVIHEAIARLYHGLEEFAEAAAYHRRIVEVSQALGSDIGDYARSLLYVANYHVNQEDGDLQLAKEYLSVLATSNVEEVRPAGELLKRVNARISAMQAGAGQSDPQSPGDEPKAMDTNG